MPKSAKTRDAQEKLLASRAEMNRLLLELELVAKTFAARSEHVRNIPPHDPQHHHREEALMAMLNDLRSKAKEARKAIRKARRREERLGKH